MNTYIFSKWKTAPNGNAVEYYSELDASRYETRKIEISRNGRMDYASRQKSTGNTRLGIIPVPDLNEILSLNEFETKEITAHEFEAKWSEATK